MRCAGIPNCSTCSACRPRCCPRSSPAARRWGCALTAGSAARSRWPASPATRRRRGTTAAHVARAAVEAIAYQSAELLAAMQKDTGCAVHEVRADGGAARNDLLMQFQADLLGVPVIRPKVTETTALGAAYLAGLAVGFWGSLDEIAAQWQAERRFEPAMPAAEREARMARWQRAVERSRSWT